jgi:Tfp pilus assembly protein PilF
MGDAEKYVQKALQLDPENNLALEIQATISKARSHKENK